MMMSASHGRVVNVGGQALFVVLDGPKGAPWLIFSNSLATDFHLWDAQVQTLAKNWRILRYDYRGHGGSASPISPLLTTNELKADLLGLMDFVGVGQAHHVGVSMGSVAGAAAALEQPHRFASLTFCNCRLKSSNGSAYDLNERADRALASGMQTLVPITLEKWFGRSRRALDDGARSNVASMIAGTQPQGFAAYAKGLREYDLESVLNRSIIPISIIVGGDDGEIAPYLRQLAEERSFITFTSIEGVGHLPNIHAPKEFEFALMGFLRTVI